MAKVGYCREKGTFHITQLKTDIFDRLIVFGEQPYTDQKTPLIQGDYEILIARVLPFLREIFDLFEVITLVGKTC